MNEFQKDMTAKAPRTFFDRAAILSVVLAFAPPLLTYIILNSMDSMVSNARQATPSYQHFLNYFIGGAFYFIFACEAASFALALVSLFGNRSRPTSFWQALVAFLASGILGYICYSIARYGLGSLGC